ncbi:MAG: hypothetical protein HOI43_02080 [Gammaproteobacteria bacterium]|nr:hypothetical protein [Gammaproteobacteria bacterium]
MTQFSVQRRDHLFLAVLVSVMAHALLFSFDHLGFKTTQSRQSGQVLSMVLKKIRPARSAVIDSQSRVLLDQPVSQVVAEEIDGSRRLQHGPVGTAPEEQERLGEPLKLDQVSGWELYRQAILTIREGSFTPLSRQRTFSVDDLPLKRHSKPGSSSRPSLLAPLISQPSRSEIVDDFGQSMVKVSDGFGNIVCMQERRDWSDGGIHFKGAADRMRNPALMYRLSKEHCGHLD